MFQCTTWFHCITPVPRISLKSSHTVGTLCAMTIHITTLVPGLPSTLILDTPLGRLIWLLVEIVNMIQRITSYSLYCGHMYARDQEGILTDKLGLCGNQASFQWKLNDEMHNSMMIMNTDNPCVCTSGDPPSRRSCKSDVMPDIYLPVYFNADRNTCPSKKYDIGNLNWQHLSPCHQHKSENLPIEICQNFVHMTLFTVASLESCSSHSRP